jgi:hypothetical protein
MTRDIRIRVASVSFFLLTSLAGGLFQAHAQDTVAIRAAVENEKLAGNIWRPYVLVLLSSQLMRGVGLQLGAEKLKRLTMKE